MADSPQYLRIAADLRRRISAGEWPVGSVIPKRLQLAGEYGVAKETVADATRLLEGEGALRSVRRLGTVVLPPGRSVLDRTNGDRLDAAAGQWVDLAEPERASVRPPADIAAILGVGDDAEVPACRRLLGDAEGRPAVVVYSYRPHELEPTSWDTETVSARIPSDEEARLLEVSSRTPLLRVLAVGGGGAAVDVWLTSSQQFEVRYAIHAGERKKS